MPFLSNGFSVVLFLFNFSVNMGKSLNQKVDRQLQLKEILYFFSCCMASEDFVFGTHMDQFIVRLCMWSFLSLQTQVRNRALKFTLRTLGRPP